MATNKEIGYSVALNINEARKQLQELQKLARQTQSPQARAAATQLIEQERRLTAETRAASQERIKLAQAEGRAREQAAKAAAQAAIEAERRATIAARQQAIATRPTVGTGGGGGAPVGGGLYGGLANAAIGGIAGYLTLQGAQAIAGQAAALADLDTQAKRAAAGFNILSGGAEAAQRNLLAIQQAAGGAITELKAIEIGNQLAGMGLANTAEEFGNLTRAARQITLVSPVISDMGEALTQLALFAANETSFARADQLGLTATEVKERMAELQAENEELDGSQAKLLASTQLLEEKYGELLSTTEANASGMERLRTVFAELRAEFAQGIGGGINESAGGFAAGLNAMFGLGNPQELQAGLQGVIARNREALSQMSDGGQGSDFLRNTREIEELARIQAEVNKAFIAGAQDAEVYQQQITEIATTAVNWERISEDQVAALVMIAQWLGTVSDGQGGYAQNSMDAAAAAQESARAKREDAEATFEALTQLQQLIARAGEFSEAQLPGVGNMQQELIALQIEIGSTNTLTDEQSAAIAQADSRMDSAASAVNFMATAEGQAAIATGQLNSELIGTPGYLDAAATAAANFGVQIQQAMALESQMRAQLAGGLGGLIGRGLLDRETAEGILATQQGMITQGANQLSDPNLSPEQRILMQAELTAMLEAPIAQIEEAERQRVEAAREAEAEQKRAIREAESAQKKAAREAERAFKEAADTAADAFEEAASQLESDLRGVAGLFSASSVTAEEMAMAEGGVAVNRADNFLRRLRDEVENGKDWEGVSLDMAREALGRVGIQAASDPKAVVAQITDAWNKQILFAAEENLALIDMGAVQADLDLQERAREGQQNILEQFGLSIDEASQDAVDALKQQIMAGTLEMTTLEDGRRVPTELLNEELAKAGLGAGATGGLTKEAVSAVQQKVFEQFQAAQEQAGSESPLADGLVNADWGAKAAETWDKIRGGFTSDENLQKGLSLGGNIANIIRDGLTNMINTPDWAESIATALFSQVMASVSAQLEAGA